MNVLPGVYIAAINEQIAEEKKTAALNAKMGIKKSGVIVGLEMAKTIVRRVYNGCQEDIFGQGDEIENPHTDRFIDQDRA
jgi:hypothetical protein